MSRIPSRSLVVLLGLLAVRCGLGEAGPASASSARLAFVGVHVVPMTSEAVLRSHTVLVEDGRVVQVAPDSMATVPDGTEIVRAPGHYLMPGLADLHVHLRAESELDAYLRHGVTTVAALRGTQTVLDLREKVRSAPFAAPRMLTAGPLLDGDPPIWGSPATRVVTSVDDARAAADEHCRSNVELLKVYNNLHPDLLETIISRGHACGLAVFAHLPRTPVRRQGLTRALAAGVDVVAHGEEIYFTHLGGGSDPEIDRGARPVADAVVESAVAAIQNAGAFVIPNLSFLAMTARMLDDPENVFADPAFARLPPDVQELWRTQNPTRRPDLDAFATRERVKRAVVMALTRRLRSAGVPLLLGTDASAPGLFPGRSAHLELEELVKAGLTPYEALAAGTRNAARFLERFRRPSSAIERASPAGMIEPGRAADLILLRDNPLEDVRHAASIEGVVIRGRWMPREPRRE